MLGQLAQGAGIDMGGMDMLKNLMLAQAQACFYEKAVKDKRIAPGEVSGSPKPLAMLAGSQGREAKAHDHRDTPTSCVLVFIISRLVCVCP